ncbi:helix-turn-helix domain-containing protein [Acidocella aminolytica]|uniref:Transcriptional regulator Fis n=1 Tax=Acidocella aminolytica 101 = DSM 11237 TaxID=1120923 RepID=A0A0D6PKA3_9PROT|nr:recombinase family protein [Acidocella aminolytica]GAN81866.1 transcriptional regulator Fis [Acidocella aminolytica 101 = DSM 11237]GBQ39953.1 DNA resolvase [Acidocella aminolytica 101 = DSM 11237]
MRRTSTGRISAKARGVRFGPRPSLSAEQIAHARQLIEQEGKPVAEFVRLFGGASSDPLRALAAKPV